MIDISLTKHEYEYIQKALRGVIAGDKAYIRDRKTESLVKLACVIISLEKKFNLDKK